MLRNALHRVLLLAWAISFLLGGGMAYAGSACGDDKLLCGDQEKCCEHRVATFCKDQACSSIHVEGQCVPQERACDEFWCGNRQCTSSWILSKNVCCVYYNPGNDPAYSCAASELSCPGNTAQLTIRPTTVASIPTE
jgi:hypothetical protein